MKRLLLALAIALFPFTAGAVEPDEMLEDAALEARAREISKELRCVVCQNQDIDSSNAGVARDLRLLVRERLLAGDSDAEVIEYIRARYGCKCWIKIPQKCWRKIPHLSGAAISRAGDWRLHSWADGLAVSEAAAG